MSDFQLTRTLDEHTADAALREDVLRGLTQARKVLPPKWFYDARGSELFEEITRLPEYYPTRAERRSSSRGPGRSLPRAGPGRWWSWVPVPRRRPGT